MDAEDEQQSPAQPGAESSPVKIPELHSKSEGQNNTKRNANAISAAELISSAVPAANVFDVE